MKLGLGTVQFGLPYGISNRKGQPTRTEVGLILARAEQAGIRMLDTAAAYGESESIIGELASRSRFQVVTKVAKVDLARNRAVAGSFQQSLDRLRAESVYGLLVHDADDLLHPQADRVWEQLVSLRESGRVTKIGASVYSPEQVEALIKRFPVDLVQVPLNVFDQRLISGGHLRELRSRSIEVHARSVYLQGLLVMDPAHLGPYFAPIRDRLVRFQRSAQEAGFSPLEAALSFVLHVSDVDVALVGVNSVAELEPALACAQRAPLPLDFSEFAVNEPAYVNPALWPRTPA